MGRIQRSVLTHCMPVFLVPSLVLSKMEDSGGLENEHNSHSELSARAFSALRDLKNRLLRRTATVGIQGAEGTSSPSGASPTKAPNSVWYSTSPALPSDSTSKTASSVASRRSDPGFMDKDSSRATSEGSLIGRSPRNIRRGLANCSESSSTLTRRRSFPGSPQSPLPQRRFSRGSDLETPAQLLCNYLNSSDGITGAPYESIRNLSVRERNLCDDESVQRALHKIIIEGKLQKAFFVMFLFERPRVNTFKKFDRMCLAEGAIKATRENSRYLFRMIGCMPVYDGLSREEVEKRFKPLSRKMQDSIGVSVPLP